MTANQSKYDAYSNRKFNATAVRDSMWLGTRMDPQQIQKEKYVRMEKIQKNLKNREKEHKLRIDEILKRSDQKEKAKEKLFKNKNQLNLKEQEKRTERFVKAK